MPRPVDPYLGRPLLVSRFNLTLSGEDEGPHHPIIDAEGLSRLVEVIDATPFQPLWEPLRLT